MRCYPQMVTACAGGYIRTRESCSYGRFFQNPAWILSPLCAQLSPGSLCAFSSSNCSLYPAAVLSLEPRHPACRWLPYLTWLSYTSPKEGF